MPITTSEEEEEDDVQQQQQQQRPRHPPASSSSSTAAAIAEKYRNGVILLSATLLSSYGLLIQSSKTDDGEIPYNSTGVNFLIESTKEFICLSAFLYFEKSSKSSSTSSSISSSSRTNRTNTVPSDDVVLSTGLEVAVGEELDDERSGGGGENSSGSGGAENDDAAAAVAAAALPLTVRDRLMFALPALLYMIDNNLTYVILQYLDAATVAVVWNLKILTTAILYRWGLGRPIRNLQWLAIWLLLFGIVTTQSHKLQRDAATTCTAVAAGANETVATTEAKDDSDTPSSASSYLIGMVLVLVGVTLSSMAGICCEYIYKKRPDMSYVHQNSYFCAYGMIFNLLTLVYESSGGSGRGRHHPRWFEGFTPLTILLVVNSTCTGLLVGYMFKVLDNIAVVFAHAESMILTALASVVLFRFVLGVEFACGVGVSVIALYLYDVDPKHFLVDAAEDNDDAAARPDHRHRRRGAHEYASIVGRDEEPTRAGRRTGHELT